jgi:ligand-binding SRPBCC domain-containing protein
MDWKDYFQILFYSIGSVFSVFSIYSIYQARRQYRRSLRHRTAESLRDLEERFATFEDILPLIDPESGRYELELEPSVRKSLRRLPQSQRTDKDRRLIFRLDWLLRFLLLLTALEKYELLRVDALRYMYLYWFHSVNGNPHLRSYLDTYFPTLANALDNDPLLLSGKTSENTFAKETYIEASPARVFAFHEQPDALTQLCPPWESAHVAVTANISDLNAEAIIHIRILKLFSVRWIARYTLYDPPHTFEDVQVKGPFRNWRHVHIVKPYHGGAILRDEIYYEPPFGLVGRKLAQRLIQKRLQRLFTFRHEVTRRWCCGMDEG